jgi:putative mRNA 3-end processing factor
MSQPELVVTTAAGLYCSLGDFYIDPWAPVSNAVITHAHADHARPGSERYLTAPEGRRVLQARLGPEAQIETLEYGQPLSINGVTLSLHPAGHILGSAQVRLEYRGDVWVVSGDYKVVADQTCVPFEPVRCRVFITESTFGLPIYHWAQQEVIFREINDWWRTNAGEGRASVVFAYALGKAQRLLAGLETGIGPVACHGAVHRMNEAYRRSGIDLPPAEYVGAAQGDWSAALILAPPSARATPWLRRFGEFASAFASGWMQLRGARRRRTVERGFVLSDHADWDGLIGAIRATGAERVLVTHGTIAPMVRWLNEQGWEASPIATLFEGEQDENAALDPDLPINDPSVPAPPELVEPAPPEPIP